MANPVTIMEAPIRLEYRYTPGVAPSRFLRKVAEGKLIGQRCSQCTKVYVPTRGSCPRCGIPTDEEVEVFDKGTVTTFCVVNIPFAGSVQVPYVAAAILLDGASIPLTSLIQEASPEDVRMGMRVQAVWVPEEEMKPSMESIKYFKPIDEPDVPIDEVLEKMLSA